jgi:hypothetical protein
MFELETNGRFAVMLEGNCSQASVARVTRFGVGAYCPSESIRFSGRSKVFTATHLWPASKCHFFPDCAGVLY